MNKQLQKCAVILVGSGYAIDKKTRTWSPNVLIEHKNIEDELVWWVCEPFSDSLEGRRQADAIEDWLRSPRMSHYWDKSGSQLFDHKDNHHQWRLDRIKWCIEELIK